MNGLNLPLLPTGRVCRGDHLAMLRHLKWLSDPVREAHPQLRIELAWGAPEGGLSCAKTIRSPLNRTNVALIQSMLNALPAHYASDYDLWLRIGFALHYFDEGEIDLAPWTCFSTRCAEKAEGTDFEKNLGWVQARISGRQDQPRLALGTRASVRLGRPSRWDRSTRIES
jgi:hypothetical protein